MTQGFRQAEVPGGGGGGYPATQHHGGGGGGGCIPLVGKENENIFHILLTDHFEH